MIRAAELFVKAEDVLVEVLGRIHGDGWRIMLPPMVDAQQHPSGRRRTLRHAVADHVREQVQVPDLLAGGTPDPGDGADPLGTEPQAIVVATSAAACAAVAKVEDGDAVVHAPGGDLSTDEYLWRLDVGRCWLAHDVAMWLGSRACPFTEELAMAMWEATAPDAARWRELGYFREPLPLPADVSWRDRFLRTGGRDPHPVVH